MKTRSNWRPPLDGGARKADETFQATSCKPKVHEKNNGEKLVFLPGFKGVAFLTDEQFCWLVEQAKLGALDGTVYELFHEE